MPEVDGRNWARALRIIAPTALLSAGGGAAVAHKRGKRRRFTVGKVNTPRGQANVVGERRYVKDLAEAVQKQDLPELARASKHLLWLPGRKEAEVLEDARTHALQKVSTEITGKPQEKTALPKLSPTALKALAAGGTAAGGILGALGTYAGMKGRDFAVVDTPLGAIGGRRSDVTGVLEAAKEDDKEEFKKRLGRVVPLHPVVTQALRLKTGSKEAGVMSRLAQLFRKGATKTKGWKALAKPMVGAKPTMARGMGMLPSSTRFPRAGGISDVMAAGAKQKAVMRGAFSPTPKSIPKGPGAVPKMTGAKELGSTIPKAAPRAPVAAATEGAKKPLVSGKMKALLGAGALLAAPAYVGGKLVQESGKTLRAGMSPWEPSTMARRRFS